MSRIGCDCGFNGPRNFVGLRGIRGSLEEPTWCRKLARGLPLSKSTMLRITVIPTASSPRLKLEGRIAGNAVEELRRLCEELLTGNGHGTLVLDLNAVSFIDKESLRLFRNLYLHQVIVTECAPFVAELLKEVLPC